MKDTNYKFWLGSRLPLEFTEDQTHLYMKKQERLESQIRKVQLLQEKKLPEWLQGLLVSLLLTLIEQLAKIFEKDET